MINVVVTGKNVAVRAVSSS